MQEILNDHATVLLAEDDDDDYFIFSLAVNDMPVKITLTRAENGEILMEILGKNIPGFLFLDILMPCKDGRQCIKEIRANPRYDGLPVIVYSSMQQLENIEFCFREGANLFINKAASFSGLKNTLLRIFSLDWKNGLYYPPLSQFVING